MEDLQRRLAAQMRLAFFDKLSEDLENEDPQAVDWITKLHVEMVQRVAALRPGRRDEIMDRMDSGIFGRKIKARAFRGEDMHQMVQFTYELLREIVAPDMDGQLNASLAEVEQKMAEPSPKFSVIVPAFLRSVHDLMDETIARIEKMRNDGSLESHGDS